MRHENRGRNVRGGRSLKGERKTSDSKDEGERQNFTVSVICGI